MEIGDRTIDLSVSARIAKMKLIVGCKFWEIFGAPEVQGPLLRDGLPLLGQVHAGGP